MVLFPYFQDLLVFEDVFDTTSSEFSIHSIILLFKHLGFRAISATLVTEDQSGDYYGKTPRTMLQRMRQTRFCEEEVYSQAPS